MATLNQTLQQAHQLYRARRLDEAAAFMRATLNAHPDSADAFRLAGMIARAAGRPDEAEGLLGRSLELVPDHPEGLNALGGLCFDQGRHDEAERRYRRALDVTPGHPACAVNLCRLLVVTGRPSDALRVSGPLVSPDAPANLWRIHGEAWLKTGRADEALRAFEMSLRGAPEAVPGRLGQVRALAELGRFEDALAIALPRLSASLEFGILTAKSLVSLGRWDEALQLAVQCARAQPAQTRAVFVTAQILWMRGEEAEVSGFLADMLERNAGEPTDLLCASIYRGMERFDDARRAIEQAERRRGPTAGALCERVNLCLDLDDADGALAAAERAFERSPADRAVRIAVVQARLMNGQPRQALPIIEEVLGRTPHQQFWLAMKCDALRQLGEAEYARLLDFDRMVGVYRLSPPPGFATIEAFNAALRDSLDRLHQVRTHPLDQSLKLGTQTHVDLRFVDDPVVQAFFEIVQPALRAYIEAMPEDPSHPLYSRRDPASVPTAVWSVRLQPGGRHISHVHPEGWISSAYYVDVPPRDADDGLGGALTLGMPLFSQPGAVPRRHVPAAEGNLVLFPSYLWHGTVPSHRGTRLSIAFDVTPANEVAARR